MGSRKVVSIDVETTGLDYYRCSILSLGAVVVDLDNKTLGPSFYAEINRKGFYGEPYALNMNKDLIERISEGNTEYLSNNGNIAMVGEEGEVKEAFKKWYEDFKEYNVAGKNFGTFDLRFLEPIFGRGFFNHRIIDVGTMYFDPKVDSKVPNLSECLAKASLGTIVTHNALEDAIQVGELILYKTK